MGLALGTGGKKSLNIDLNIVPFIDVMSCLTAFLLVTAVWVNIAKLETKPVGRGTDVCLDGTCDEPKLSVLINADEIWVGVSRVNDFEKIPRTQAGYDWARLEDALKLQKASAYFDHKTAIEIAADSTAEHPITYQTLIATMDIAIKTGFIDVGVTEPRSLSAYPTL
ncbi:MAG TPA: biopolymer transporter ExbD [Kofleriaceae bacterium]|nr:biopolymer transporter ExbD [Kofleriaceae bacterium]